MKTTCSSAKHSPKITGLRIRAQFGKHNLPNDKPVVQSEGQEAWCLRCGAHLIVHDSRLGYPVPYSELEGHLEDHHD
jgi:hypothetical protein